MRILILSNYANGIWLYRKELVQSFIDDGHEVYISVPPDENCEKLTKLGFTVIETKLDRHGLNPIKDMALFREYLKLIKKYRPGVVLTYTIKPNIYGASAARLKRVPYICNITGLGKAVQGGGLLSRVLVSMYRFSMGKARKVFFQNEGNMKILQKRGIAKKNAALLPGSGVNTTEHPLRDYPDESGGIIILAVLRMMKDKGVGEYLEAVEKLSDKLPNLKFELVGEYEEDERHIYEPMIEALVSKGILKYYGHIDNVEEVMSRCHVVVHPSYHEGMSNVLLEAAACGRPVLTSNIPGCREAVIEGKNGFLFRSESAEALISSIEKIASLSTEERKAMGLEGRKFIVENFDRDIIISRYRQELAKL
ncbi:glycosyltransferase family 4 protein [Butyrivibrio sp. AE2032]|uniref:glycosyltransferase family 4 protein n=1 Tax=Butyrivibrio sp. AE2032 TaxID=1458463 RepID=UPI000552EB28|nr:glycosyltransferase family 4 protein [Butyrivibrio sp. AE2032]